MRDAAGPKTDDRDALGVPIDDSRDWQGICRAFRRKVRAAGGLQAQVEVGAHMDGKYTLSVYVAAPGTPLLDGGTSAAGHVY